MGVVEQPVHGRGCDRLWHQAVESDRVQVRGDDHRPHLVGGVDHSQEGFCLLLGDRKHPNVVDHDQIAADQLVDRATDRLIDQVPAEKAGERTQSVPDRAYALVDHQVGEGFSEVVLAASTRTAEAEVLSAGRPTAGFEGLAAACSLPWISPRRKGTRRPRSDPSAGRQRLQGPRGPWPAHIASEGPEGLLHFRGKGRASRHQGSPPQRLQARVPASRLCRLQSA